MWGGGGKCLLCMQKTSLFLNGKDIYCICIASICFMADLNLHGIDEQKG